MRLLRATRAFISGLSPHSEVLAAMQESLVQTIELKTVTDIVLGAVRNHLKTRKATILLWEEERLEFIPVATYGAGKFEITIPTGHFLVTAARTVKGTLTPHVIENTKDFPTTAKETAKNTFAWLDVTAVVPFFVHHELVGLLLLGEKENGRPYTAGELRFLNKVAPLAGATLENARVLKQAVEFSAKLRAEVGETNNELSQANIQLRNLDRAKSEFLSIASHQLYTPLTALRGYISMMRDGDFGAIPDKQLPVLDILEKSATRLIELIKNLLDVSRIESGRLELKLESVDLIELAKELVADLMPNAIHRDLQMEFHEPATPVQHVVIDHERVRQVILNFIDNAIKYTSFGNIDVYVYQKADTVIFAVKDTGKGMTRDEIAQLFHKFTRVGGASRFDTEGTGLGLYVARQIVREHHGEVVVESMGESQGSTFAMQLPAEGTKNSLKVGEHATIVIRAAEAQPLNPVETKTAK